ncbi:phosphoethanolamine transferase [Lampropedia cohaerens]|nr:phosphoethanolamine--lipid A transferase [Lampropedia cohaerens]
MQAINRPRSAQATVVILCAWLTVAAHWPLWRALQRLDGYDGPALALFIVFVPLVFAVLVLLFALTAWPRGMKPLWLLLLALAAVGQYFALHYGTVIDKGMVLNVLQTDLRESRDLFNPRLLVQVCLVAGVPALWLWRLPVIRYGIWQNIARTLVLILAALTCIAAVALPNFRQLAPVVRSNMTLRYMINPLNSVAAVYSATLKPMLQRPRPFVSITAAAALGETYSAGHAQKPPLMVIVVGETSRGDHYGINGYPRDTTPELARLAVLSWRNATACGTSTRESLPCMFSHLDKAGFEERTAEYDNLLDVLQAAGLAVLWVDNQAGCKDVCRRVPTVFTSDMVDTPAGQQLCAQGECLDAMLLEGLDARLAALPESRRRNGIVIVLHQMGSHGPAYFKRSAAPFKPFLPECASNALASCSQEQLINVYDNSIRYTDHVLARTIEWLTQHASAYQVGMLFVSDHGESLGEGGLYLHGLPYAVAPAAQKSIAMIAWPGTLAARTQVHLPCVQGTLDTAVSHDNFYHTVLGLLDVRSPTYLSALDVLHTCRSTARSAT